MPHDAEDAMGAPDEVMVRIGDGIGLSQRGERVRARELFAELWDDIGGELADPFHRCALAHSMADVQDDVHAELQWDLRALAAADLITDARVARAGVASPVSAFYPSLHLNIAECYRRIGDLDQARAHLQRGRAAVKATGNDGYIAMIADGLDRLASRLPPSGHASDVPRP